MKKRNTESESDGDEVEDERGEDESKGDIEKYLKNFILKRKNIVLIKF